jgi:hypothetical protein
LDTEKDKDQNGRQNDEHRQHHGDKARLRLPTLHKRNYILEQAALFLWFLELCEQFLLAFGQLGWSIDEDGHNLGTARIAPQVWHAMAG